MSDDAPGVSPVTPTERRHARRRTRRDPGPQGAPWRCIGNGSGPSSRWPITLCVLFLAASWFGLWLAVPIWARIAGVAVTGLPSPPSLGAAVLKPRPTWRESLGRLDRDSALPHRPATALSDELAINTAGPRHARAVGSCIAPACWSRPPGSRSRRPRPRLAERDPWALRFAVALDRHRGFFRRRAGAGGAPQGGVRLDGPPAPVAAFRIDGWIDPPAYTQVPPVLLDLRRHGRRARPSLRSRCPPIRRWSSGPPTPPGSRSTSPAA